MKAMSRLTYIVNAMALDSLATQGVKQSASMVIT